MIKLVASDLDGTLLRNGEQELPRKMLPLIRELKKKGIRFAAASGRQYANMKRLFAPVFDDMTFICENGAVAFQRGERLYEDIFERELLMEILSEAYKKEGTEFLCSTTDFYYVMPKSEDYIQLMTKEIDCEYRIVKSLEEIDRPCVKAGIYEKEGITQESIQYWTERFGDRCKVVTSGFAWLDFVPFHTNKARGIKKLRDMYGIGPEECVVFGDEYNDIEMLKSVTYSFAMATAKEGVKEAAAYETETVEEVLEKLLLAEGNMEEVLK